MPSVVIYVLGRDNQQPRVWENAHPRVKRVDTTLVFFDYVADLRKTWLKWDGSQPPKTKADDETQIGSILDLYSFIKSANSRSISELHFFTHGWEGGPVLYNTNDYSTDDAKRDPDDYDPRLKDFLIPDVLGGSERAKFANAFDPGALVKLWGCTYIEAHRQMIKRDFYNSKATEDQKKAIKATIRNFIRDGTYQYHLAKAIGLPVYAAPLGWGTNPYLPFGIYGRKANDAKPKWRGVWPPKVGDRWWSVSQHFRPDGGRSFYTSELKAKLDILDYVAYSDSLLND